MKQLTVTATIDKLDKVLNFINSELEAKDCDINLQIQTAIAVEEIFVNIAHYAYAPDTGTAIISITVNNNEICVEFEDTGKPYNPLTHEDPDITAAVENRKIGGLGVFLVKKIMDNVEYKHMDNKNILTMKKAIPISIL